MNSQLRPKHLIANGTFIVVALIALATTYVWFPTVFTMILAIAGFSGASLVIYEVRQTKRIAQAEFIRALNEGFAANQNINELWRKLLLGEKVVPSDRLLISAYLTFFEALHLLMGRNILDFTLVDNLFRNRFFRSIGNPVIQESALFKERESFVNIHALTLAWRSYLRQKSIPLPAGYISYLSAFLHADGFTVENLKVGALAEVMALQDAIVSHLDHPEWLRENSEETFTDCLQNHVVIGLRHNGHIVAIAILVDAGDTSSNLQRFLSDTPVVIQSSCNLKLVAVHPDFRGRGLASSLIELLEGEATKRGFRRIVCTVHPYNRASRSIFTTLGYRVKKKVQTSYGKRMIYQRTFQVLTRGAIK